MTPREREALRSGQQAAPAVAEVLLSHVSAPNLSITPVVPKMEAE